MKFRTTVLSHHFSRALAALSLALTGQAAQAVPAERLVQLRSGAVVHTQSTQVGSLSSNTPVSFAVTLPWRHQAELSALLKRLYDPADPVYRHFLTPQEFAAQFGPAQSDYDAVIAWAKASGITVTATSSNRHVIGLSAPAGAIEAALHMRLGHFVAVNGRHFRAPTQDVSVTASIARRITGFAGLSTASLRHINVVARAAHTLSPRTIGTGPSGGMSPANIHAAYGLAATAENGSGQTIAVVELAGYTASDINTYTDYFGLPRATLNNILVSGGPDYDPSGMIETTLDIELIAAMASTAPSIAVYEAPNTDAGVLAAYNQIATDNTARQISMSWGLDEASVGSAVLQSEDAIVQQYAAQGQCLYAAAGDNGAYDNGRTLSVDDPGSQPYVVAVGGTTLATASLGGAWQSETTWNSGSVSAGAGGGGISSFWTLPSYQSGVSGISGTKRNVPDISLDADPNTGYAIYVNGGWEVYGGTSAGAPLWAAFHALVNERRTLNGLATLGFASPRLYSAAATSTYTSAFHDIADGSTNLYYPAVTGYDRATGLGTMQGEALLNLLSTDTTTGVATSVPQSLQATAGDGSVTLTWTASSGATSYTIYRHTATDTTFSALATTSATTYADSAVGNGVAYTYVVTATGGNGESGYSNEATATPQAAVTATTSFTAGIHLFSLPYTYSGISLDTLFGYSGVTLYVYDPAQSAYVTKGSVVPGIGYWVRFPTAVTVANGTPVNTSQDYTISLAAGWNQIGDPFTTSVAVNALEVGYHSVTYTFADASASYGLVSGTLYRYDTGSAAYVAVTSGASLVPNQGYWIYAFTPVTLVVPHL